MSTKQSPGPFDAHGVALPDEPMFTLLGRDPLAPAVVRQWAMRCRAEVFAGTRPLSDRAKADEAERLATDMERWRRDNDGVWRHQNPTLPFTLPFTNATELRAARMNGEV